MKKILSLLLTLLILRATLVGCVVNDADNPSDTSTQIEQPEVFDTSILESEPFRDFTEISFWQNQDDEIYVYIKAWNTYRKLSEISPYVQYYLIEENPTSVVIGEDTAVISFVLLEKKIQSPMVLTCHFNRNDKLVKSYLSELDEITIDRERGDLCFINMKNETLGYYFVLPQYAHFNDPEISVNEKCWPIIRFETFDGGKTWSYAETSKGYEYDHTKACPTIAKFISREVGIFNHRYYYAGEDLCLRTYITKDGGLTWNNISSLPYPFDMDDISYTEAYDLEQCADGYILTVEVRSDVNDCQKIKFKSVDLENWELITND